MLSTVAAPSLPLILATSPSHYHCSEYAWLYPFTKPTPGGLLHVSNAIIDLDGRIGAWSEPAVLAVESGWRLFGGAWNQPIVEDAAGIAWKVKIVEMNPDGPSRFGSNAGNPQASLSMSLYEAMEYPRVLTDAEILQVESYFYLRFAL
jgi:hypothetical protein